MRSRAAPPMPERKIEGGDALIHLRVPAATKARWVRESRAAGMRLGDWIVRAVEARMPVNPITIPDDVSFSDLRYAREPDGSVSFDWAPIERICSASGIDIRLMRDGPEDNLAALISHWYRAHLAAGGARDAAMDDLIAEVDAENARGQHVSHAPGQA